MELARTLNTVAATQSAMPMVGQGSPSKVWCPPTYPISRSRPAPPSERIETFKKWRDRVLAAAKVDGPATARPPPEFVEYELGRMDAYIAIVAAGAASGGGNLPLSPAPSLDPASAAAAEASFVESGRAILYAAEAPSALQDSQFDTVAPRPTSRRLRPGSSGLSAFGSESQILWV